MLGVFYSRCGPAIGCLVEPVVDQRINFVLGWLVQSVTSLRARLFILKLDSVSWF